MLKESKQQPALQQGAAAWQLSEGSDLLIEGVWLHLFSFHRRRSTLGWGGVKATCTIFRLWVNAPEDL